MRYDKDGLRSEHNDSGDEGNNSESQYQQSDDKCNEYSQNIKRPIKSDIMWHGE